VRFDANGVVSIAYDIGDILVVDLVSVQRRSVPGAHSPPSPTP
jgi:hypothetical protein